MHIFCFNYAESILASYIIALSCKGILVKSWSFIIFILASIYHGVKDIEIILTQIGMLHSFHSSQVQTMTQLY